MDAGYREVKTLGSASAHNTITMKRHRTRHSAQTAPTHQAPDFMAVLASGMADDFNNILTTVMGACTLIDRDDPANGELLQYVSLIRRSAERAADLSGRLMRASTLEQDGTFAGNPPQDFSDLVTSLRDSKSINDIVPSTKKPGGSVS